MEAPDKIYVEIRHPFSKEYTEMLGFVNKGNTEDIEYVRKDALLEWAKEWAKRYPYSNKFQMIIDKLNSM